MIARLRLYLRIARVLSHLNADGTHCLADFAEIVGGASMFRRGYVEQLGPGLFRTTSEDR